MTLPLREWRGDGLRVSIDSLGTGYSPLSFSTHCRPRSSSANGRSLPAQHLVGASPDVRQPRRHERRLRLDVVAGGREDPELQADFHGFGCAWLTMDYAGTVRCSNSSGGSLTAADSISVLDRPSPTSQSVHAPVFIGQL